MAPPKRNPGPDTIRKVKRVINMSSDGEYTIAAACREVGWTYPTFRLYRKILEEQGHAFKKEI